ncbi:MAG: MFS transporter [Phycisphaerales bacterium]|nr:MFS transporter [Phycisphaerales bacterium]
MRWPPPFRSLPDPRSVWAWGMYDLANQSFTLLIITLLFPIYFKDIAVGDPQKGDSLWSMGASGSLFLVVLLSPIVGAYTDRHRKRKIVLVGTGLCCVLLTAMLVLVQPGAWWIGLAIFIPANIMYQLGENMLASFLPGISTPRTIGRISAIGWTMGYIGGLLLLAVVAVGAKLLGWKDPSQWRPFFLIAALWFAIGMIPTAIFVKEPDATRLPGAPASAGDRVRLAILHLKNHRQLIRFLVSFFVYGFGVQTMIMFAAILAADFGIEGNRLILFTLQLTVTAGATAIVVAKFQDRLGIRTTILSFLAVWIVSCGALLAVKLIIPINPPEWIFWAIGNGIGVGLGGIGTASRSVVGFFAPKHRTAEFFGFWGMSYKLAGAIGVLSFGQVKAWIGDAAALGLLTSFFVLGLVLFLRVDLRSGRREAMRAERAHRVIVHRGD